MLSKAQVAELVERMLKASGRRIDLSQPFVDAMLPSGPQSVRKESAEEPYAANHCHR